MNERAKFKSIDAHIFLYILIPLVILLVILYINERIEYKSKDYYSIPSITYKGTFENKDNVDLTIHYPSKDMDNFLSFKPYLIYENFYKQIGKKFDIDYIKKNFSFGYIICANELNICKVYNKDGYNYMDIILDKDKNIKEIISIYLDNTSMVNYPDKVLTFEEIVRLNDFLQGIGKVEYADINSNTKVFYVKDKKYKYSAVVTLPEEVNNIKSLDDILNIRAKSSYRITVKISISKIK